MIDKSIAKKVLENCLTTGADFAEIYFESKVENNIRMVSGVVDDITTSHTYGVGIRILKEFQEVYGYTNEVSEEGLQTLANNLKQGYNGVQTTRAQEFKEEQFVNKHPVNVYSKDIPNSKKIGYMKVCCDTIKAYDERIIQAMSSIWDETQEVTVYNSNGVCKKDVRNHQRLSAVAVASDGTTMQQGAANYGGNFGLDAFENYDLVAMSKEAAKSAITMLTAPEMVGGVYDVIIDNGFGGVIFHEACGHSLEATGVAKNLSVFSGKLGEKIAADCVTAIDDGTIPNSWGSANMDDEGNETRRNVLIENGILKGYMVDMRNGRRMKMEQTGSSRRQNYRFSPTSRMTNTFIANGESTLEEIIANTKYGLYAKEMGGGSVNPATGEFNFTVSEGYMVEDGKITHPVRGAALIGNGKDTLLKIDMVANNCSFGHGMCGSNSGSIPANVGQPSIRVKQMTVGGSGVK